MISVSILGVGNVGSHLLNAFRSNPAVKLVQLYSRTRGSDPTDNLPWCNDLQALKPADLYILTVPDDQIRGLSAKLPFSNRLIAHTSGSVALDELDFKNRRAVFYPLQSFNREAEVDMAEVPVCIETEDQKDLGLLRDLAYLISKKVVVMDSQKRLKLHLAAVIVNNFTNHLFHIAREQLQEQDIDFELLKPLIKKTVDKLDRLTPAQAQTGPARRGDLSTINKHLKLVSDSDQRAMYELMTDLILKAHGKKL